MDHNQQTDRTGWKVTQATVPYSSLGHSIYQRHRFQLDPIERRREIIRTLAISALFIVAISLVSTAAMIKAQPPLTAGNPAAAASPNPRL